MLPRSIGAAAKGRRPYARQIRVAKLQSSRASVWQA